MNKLYIILSMFLFIGACKSDNETEKTDISLDSEFFEGYYENNISTSITSFKNEITTEITNIKNFKENKTDSNFDVLKSQWLNCAKAYAKVRVYDFGLIENKFFDKKIYNYPVSTTLIESYIAEEVIYDFEYLNSKSIVVKGLGTLEYLIFADNDSEQAKKKLVNNSYRIDYLLVIAQDVLEQTNLLISTWEDGYKQTFVNYDEESCTKNATCLCFNELINIIDVTKVTKIGKTAGLESSNNIALDDLEAFRSRSSLILVQSMLEEVKYAYQGSDYNFATLIDQIDDEKVISTAIDNQFIKLDKVITDLDNNLYDAINDDNTTVKPLYDALGELTILLSVDVGGLLNLTILPTDNDGD